MTFLPFLSKYRFLIVLLLLLTMGAGLRLYNLTQVPSGITWDEAAIAYDGWGIATWRRDHWVNRLPLTFKSFGDYKAPFLIYLSAFAYVLFDFWPYVPRVLSALFGIGLIPLAYLLGLKLKLSQWWALVMAGLVGFSYWGIPFSRIGLEATVAVTLVALGMLLCLSPRRFNHYAGMGFLILSAYTYHAPKLTIPLLLIGFFWYWRRKGWLSSRGAVITAVLWVMVLLAPLGYSLLQGGGERAYQALYFMDRGMFDFSQDQFLGLGQTVINHLNPFFWTHNTDTNLRHGVAGFSVLPWVLLPFFYGGVLFVFRLKKKKGLRWRLILLWLAAALVPSLLSRDGTHNIRSLGIMVPTYLMATYGLSRVFGALRTQKVLRLGLGLVLFLGVAGQTGAFIANYFGRYRVVSAPAFQYGYKEVHSLIRPLIKGEDRVVFTDMYGQPYIYTLIYRQIPPKEFHAGALAQFEFRPIKWPEYKETTLFVGSGEEIPHDDPRVQAVIWFPDGSPAFVVAR